MTVIKEMEHGYAGYIAALKCAFSAVATELNARAPESVGAIIRHHEDTGANDVKLLEATLGTTVANLEKIETGLPLRILEKARQELPHFGQLEMPGRPHEIEIRNKALRTHFDTIIRNVRNSAK